MQSASTQYIQVGSASISYRSAGEGTPLVFIHAFPFNQQMWDSQFEKLQNKNTVITYDIRGFGNSSAGNENPSIDLFASDLIGLLDHLKINSCVACGLSMGGYILMNAASRFPERFKAVVLCDTQCIADSEEGKKKRAETIDKIEKEGLEKFTDTFLKSVFTATTVEMNTELVDKAKKMILQNKKETVTSALKSLAERKETCNAIKGFKMPALVICGKEDQLTPLTQSELIFNSIDKAEIKVISGAGHLSNLEQEEEFNRHLEGFLSKIR